MVTTYITTSFIIGVSVLLFLYWFRYTCLLILSAKSTRDYAGAVAAANQLGFVEVQNSLRKDADLQVERLKGALDRDYELLGKLLKSHRQLDASVEIEQQMLRLYYRCLSVWCTAMKPVSPAATRAALNNMAEVVTHFANLTGERSFAGAAA
jgi:hypothetical protein